MESKTWLRTVVICTSEVFDVHESELGVGALLRNFVNPFGYGFDVATGPRASEDDGYSIDPILSLDTR
jgi:hypothetical protein